VIFFGVGTVVVKRKKTKLETLSEIKTICADIYGHYNVPFPWRELLFSHNDKAFMEQ
jgi:hypothetical protein